VAVGREDGRDPGSCRANVVEPVVAIGRLVGKAYVGRMVGRTVDWHHGWQYVRLPWRWFVMEVGGFSQAQLHARH
jgi:hypothetical protein